jgi:methyl-accepting chemotaxis protein
MFFNKSSKNIELQLRSQIVDLETKLAEQEQAHIQSEAELSTSLSDQKAQNAEFKGQVDAINTSQAVIEFTMDGVIESANENFLTALGYSLDEIKGKHHSLFLDAAYKNTTEYREFWQILNRGEFLSGEYKRLGKGGKEVWIQASYNPIMDAAGKPFKVVKYATNITGRKFAVSQISESLLALSQGDLSNTIDVPLEGEFEILKEAMNTTIKHFSDMVSQIRTSADFVSSSANEIQTGTADLSQRTESQASSLEETSSSVEQVTQTVNQNAESSNSSASDTAELELSAF